MSQKIKRVAFAWNRCLSLKNVCTNNGISHLNARFLKKKKRFPVNTKSLSEYQTSFYAFDIRFVFT